MAKQKHSKVTKAILETAEGLHRAGVMRDEDYRRITTQASTTRAVMELADFTEADIAMLEASSPPEATKSFDDELPRTP